MIYRQKDVRKEFFDRDIEIERVPSRVGEGQSGNRWKTNREIDKKADLKKRLKDNEQRPRIFMAVDLTTQNRLVVRQINERRYLIEYKGSEYVVNVKGNFFVINKLG